MNHRADDPTVFKIDRVIPFWGIISLCVAGFAQAVVMWSAQGRQSDVTERLEKAFVAQSAELTKLTSAVGAKDLKDLEQDFKMQDALRRLTAIEGERRR